MLCFSVHTANKERLTVPVGGVPQTLNDWVKQQEIDTAWRLTNTGGAGKKSRLIRAETFMNGEAKGNQTAVHKPTFR